MNCSRRAVNVDMSHTTTIGKLMKMQKNRGIFKSLPPPGGWWWEKNVPFLEYQPGGRGFMEKIYIPDDGWVVGCFLRKW